jgi:soluble lytic murein transglycosylase-like protein
VDYSDEHKLDYKWTTAIGNIESTYDRNAKNNHSVGIMQINKPWWVKELKEKEYIKTEKDLYNPVNNIRSGCYILKQKLEQTGNIYKAVTWYNKVDGDLTYLSFVIDKYNRYKEFENGWESKRKSI